jgi:hexosaminidase
MNSSRLSNSLMAIALSLGLAACGPSTPAPTPTPEPSLGLLPLPARVSRGGGLLHFDEPVAVRVSGGDDALLSSLESWIAERRAETGTRFELSYAGPAAGPAAGSAAEPGDVSIQVGTDPTDVESYSLTADATGVRITAASSAGAFYALQTLRQLVTSRDGQLLIPAISIVDAPRFSYRGLHLDVGRHFFGVDEVKRYIDLMSRYKFNTFHWHLTEDQGWRMPIDAYPRLTEVSSCRAETMVEKNFDPYVGDGTPHCGFYTKDEIREVVRYAAERFVTVIPEIELPGHSLAALAAYPELACTPGPFQVGTRWGVFDDIYCPSEETFAFLEAVLDEVIELFPGRYIHIGGDEAPKARWEESELAQEVIRREGLKDEDELQSYFIARIERFLESRGRSLIGWDEILEGGLAPDATVMSWRGMEGGIAAARQGHDVIMTPGSHVYFDHYQDRPENEPLAIGGLTPLSQVYEFEPVPAELNAEEAQHILGAQANLWTEYIATWDYAEYMAYPRALALSEVVWSRPEDRDWDSFLTRLPSALQHLSFLGVAFRIPDVEGLDEDRLTLADTVTIELSIPVSGAEIRYTVDGSDPTSVETLYDGPFQVILPERVVTVSARGFLPDGRVSNLRRARIRRATLGAPMDIGPTRPGITRRRYEGEFRVVDQMLDTAPLTTDTVLSPALMGTEPEAGFGLEFVGHLQVPQDGIYTFHLASDDGSRLWIDGALVINHDGLHAPSTRRGQVALAAGAHTIRVDYFQSGGGKALSLQVQAPGWEEPHDVPIEWFVIQR